MGNRGGPGTCGNDFGTLCACAAQPPASCVLGCSAVATGGRCASGTVGTAVAPLGISTGCLGSPVAPKRVPVIGRSTLDVGSRGKQVPEGLQC